MRRKLKLLALNSSRNFRRKRAINSGNWSRCMAHLLWDKENSNED